MIKKIVTLFIYSLALWDTRSLAMPHGESEMQAASVLGEKISLWLLELRDKPGIVGIFQVRASSPLTSEYASLVESEIQRAVKRQPGLSVMACIECRAPQIKIDGDNLVVTKGAPDVESLRQLGQKNGATAFLILDLFRTTYSVVGEAILYRTSNGEVMAIEQFSVSAFELANTAMLFMLAGGPGKVLGPKITSSNIPFTLNLSALEELGFGKGGLTLGGVSSGPNGNMGYILPTLGIRGRFGATPVYSLASLGAGFAMTGSKAGLGLRATYDVFIGSFTLVGINAIYMVPINGLFSGPNQTLNGFVGLHLGVSLGR